MVKSHDHANAKITHLDFPLPTHVGLSLAKYPYLDFPLPTHVGLSFAKITLGLYLAKSPYLDFPTRHIWSHHIVNPVVINVVEHQNSTQA